MKKKFKFHCLDDESDSEIGSSAYSDGSSDDDIPEQKVPAQVSNHNILNAVVDSGINKEKFILDNDEGFFIPSTPEPPPLPSSSSSSISSPINDKQQNRVNDDTTDDIVDVDSPKQNINNNIIDEDSPFPESIPEDFLYNNVNEDIPPPEVDEVEDIEEDFSKEKNKPKSKSISKQASKKSSIPKSLKSKNNPMTREKQLILNTNKIYNYFNQRISKLSILKAIHSKCGDFRLATLALAQNSTQFDNVSLFESPKAEPEMIKEYLAV